MQNKNTINQPSSELKVVSRNNRIEYVIPHIFDRLDGTMVYGYIIDEGTPSFFTDPENTYLSISRFIPDKNAWRIFFFPSLESENPVIDIPLFDTLRVLMEIKKADFINKYELKGIRFKEMQDLLKDHAIQDVKIVKRGDLCKLGERRYHACDMRPLEFEIYCLLRVIGSDEEEYLDLECVKRAFRIYHGKRSNIHRAISTLHKNRFIEIHEGKIRTVERIGEPLLLLLNRVDEQVRFRKIYETVVNEASTVI